MSTLSTSNTEEGTAVHPDHPLDSDGLPIHWDGSPAKAIGKLRAARQWYARTGRFKTYIEKRAVMVGSKLCIESWDSLPFVRGVISDLPAGEAYSFDKPCVPTTKDNWADFLTKPLEPKTFFALRALIMNEKVSFNPASSRGGEAA